MDEPKLWAIYDESEQEVPADDLTFKAKLRGFAHLHLNMFEIMFLEAPREGWIWENQSNIWGRYFKTTLNNSKLIRDVLEEPEGHGIWSKRMMKRYAKWKKAAACEAQRK